MSDLLSILSLGSAGIAAQNSGAAVAANNVANANTAGYSRQRVDLEALLAAPTVGGVRSGTPERYASNLLNGRIQVATGSLASSQAYSDGITDFESVATAGDTIDVQLGSVFSSLSQASMAPTDPSARDGVVSSFRALAGGINRRASEVSQARHASDQRITDFAKQATTFASQLASLNAAVAKSPDPTLLDQRDAMAKQLAQITGGTARVDPDGQMRVTLDGGAVLVDGAHAASLATSPDPTTGFARVEVVDGNARRDVTGLVGSGSLGAELKLRDGTLAQVAGQLDQLAYDTATSFNATSTAAAALDGSTGHAIFVAPAAVAGAAAALALDPALDADTKNLALGTAGRGPGDNGGAVALFQLATQPVATGGKLLTDSALDVIATVAQAGSTAKVDLARDTLVSTHLDDLRDSLAGVDPQEELTNLSRFQNASEAMSKVVATVNTMLDQLITNL